MANNMIQKAVNAAPQKQSNREVMCSYVKQYEGAIKRALPAVMTPERFARIATSALTTTPRLCDCDPRTFIGAMLTAAQLGLEPNTPLGQAYLIPYGKQCQFQIGYKGLLALAYRSGQVKSIQCQVIHENDTFVYECGTELVLKHKPLMIGERGKPMAVYAVLTMKDGGLMADCMSWSDVMEHGRKFSQSFGRGPWQTNPEEMAKKTVLKRVLKYAPLSSDFVRGIAQDMTVKEAAQPEDIKAEDDILDVPGYSVDEETGEAMTEEPVKE